MDFPTTETSAYPDPDDLGPQSLPWVHSHPQIEYEQTVDPTESEDTDPFEDALGGAFATPHGHQNRRVGVSTRLRLDQQDSELDPEFDQAGEAAL